MRMRHRQRDTTQRAKMERGREETLKQTLERRPTEGAISSLKREGCYCPESIAKES